MALGGAFALVVALVAGCQRAEETKQANAPAKGATAPVSVTVVRVQQRDYPVRLEIPGSVTALNSVDVKPQVASTITQVHIREGDFVKGGQLLFTLDSRADAASVAKARAQLQKDRAALADAERQLARTRDLFAQNFVSQVAVDTSQTLVESQKAVVAADQAAVEAAAVGLSYTRIVAPTAGRAGAINVYAGSSVAPGGNLVTITQLDPVAVSFNLPQRDLPEALAALQHGGGSVQALLPEGRGVLNGKLHFVDNAIDASSGTVRAKAIFENAKLQLWPGAFVTVRVAVRTLKDAVVVPMDAVVNNGTSRVLFTVDEASKAVLRPVELVYAGGSEAVVSGVDAGERVVVEGRQNLRPGAAVTVRMP